MGYSAFTVEIAKYYFKVSEILDNNVCGNKQNN